MKKEKRLLNQVAANPMMNDPRVMSQDITFNYNELNPQVRYVLQNTKENQFSPIFAQKENYNMFYVKNKTGVKVLPFDEVKEKIFQTIMEQRETNFLNEYLEHLKTQDQSLQGIKFFLLYQNGSLQFLEQALSLGK